MKRAVLLLGALGTVASATTLVALDLEALVGASDLVVLGRVRTVTPHLTGDGQRIVTDTVVEVAEAWRGAGGPVVTVNQPGGELPHLGQRVDGTATFRPGEEVVLFLERRGDRFTVAGLAQGRFVVERSSDGRAAFARQDQAGVLHRLDALTGQEVAPAPLALSLEALRTKVRGAAPAPEPGPGRLPRVTP